MENQNISVNVPLLESPPSRPQNTYLKTGVFDTFLMFWVGKIIDVFFSLILSNPNNPYRLETRSHSNKTCIGTFVSKNLLASWPKTLLKNSMKTSIKKTHYSELLHPPPKVLPF